MISFIFIRINQRPCHRDIIVHTGIQLWHLHIALCAADAAAIIFLLHFHIIDTAWAHPNLGRIIIFTVVVIVVFLVFIYLYVLLMHLYYKERKYLPD